MNKQLYKIRDTGTDCSHTINGGLLGNYDLCYNKYRYKEDKTNHMRCTICDAIVFTKISDTEIHTYYKEAKATIEL